MPSAIHCELQSGNPSVRDALVHRPPCQSASPCWETAHVRPARSTIILNTRMSSASRSNVVFFHFHLLPSFVPQKIPPLPPTHTQPFGSTAIVKMLVIASPSAIAECIRLLFGSMRPTPSASVPI